MKRLLINDRTYTIQPLNPMEAIAYGTKIAAVIAPALSSLTGGAGLKSGAEKLLLSLGAALKDNDVSSLLKTAYDQCYTPQNESMADEVVFNKHFLAFPEDAYELGVRAAYLLVKDFFPKQLSTTLSGLDLSKVTLEQ